VFTSHLPTDLRCTAGHRHAPGGPVGYTLSVGSAVPPALAANNVAPDPPHGFAAITDATELTGTFGQRCEP